MAIASILHRLSGIALFLAFPWMLYLFSLSVQSPSGFLHAQNLMQACCFKWVLFAFAAALIYHFIAGMRHLTMDLGLGESLIGGRRSALVVLFLSFIVIILLGIKLW